MHQEIICARGHEALWRYDREREGPADDGLTFICLECDQGIRRTITAMCPHCFGARVTVYVLEHGETVIREEYCVAERRATMLRRAAAKLGLWRFPKKKRGRT